MCKLFSSLELPTTFGEIFKVTLAPFFIPDFTLYKLQIRQFCLKCYTESFYIDIISQQDYYTLMVPSEKSETGSFASSIMKNINLLLLLLL